MAEPRADQIVEAAVTALRGVSIGAGFYTDLGVGEGRVSRRRWDVVAINRTRCPLTSVWLGDWQKIAGGCIGPTDVPLRRELLIESWFAAQEEEIDRAGLRVENDIFRAMLAARTFGLSFVSLVEPAKGRNDHQQYGDKGMGWRLMRFTVEYTETASAPS